MVRAIDLAWRGWGRVHPNPLVGAMVLAGNALVGEGWHAEYRRSPRRADRAGSGRRPGPGRDSRGHPGALLPPGQAAALHRGDHPGRRPARGRRRRRSESARPAGGADEAARGRHRGRDRRPRRGRPPRRTPPSCIASATPRDPSSRSSWPPRSMGASPTPPAAPAGSPVPPAQEYIHWLRAGFDAVGVGGRTARADDPQLTVRGSVEPGHTAPACGLRRGGRSRSGPDRRPHGATDPDAGGHFARPHRRTGSSAWPRVASRSSRQRPWRRACARCGARASSRC